MKQKHPAEFTEKETETRATDALRRALTTPYKPQSEMKLGQKPKKETTAKKSPAKR